MQMTLEMKLILMKTWVESQYVSKILFPVCNAILCLVYYSDSIPMVLSTQVSSYSVTQFFCFVGLLVFAGLVAFMAISFMLKWRNTKVRYVATPGALGGGTE